MLFCDIFMLKAAACYFFETTFKIEVNCLFVECDDDNDDDDDDATVFRSIFDSCEPNCSVNGNYGLNMGLT